MEQDEQRQRGELFRASARSDGAMQGQSRYIRGPLDRNNPVSQAVSGSGYPGERSAAAAGGIEEGGGNRQQGPSQQLSWAQVRDGIDIRERQRGARSAYESVNIGREVLESLDDQKERLERSEMVLDSTRYAIETSARVIRGMSFWGRIANAFTGSPEIPEAPSRAAGEEDRTPVARSAHAARGDVAGGDPEGASPISGGLGPLVRADGAPSPASQREDLFRGTVASGNPAAGRTGGSGVIAEQKSFMAGQDQYLDAIGEAVKEMSALGRNIGASLDQQVDTLDRVAIKTEESDERAKFVTRKAARQAQSSKPKKPMFVKKVALQELSTGLFVTVVGDEVALKYSHLHKPCLFEAWQRQEGMLGFKSKVTGKWLGITFFGYLRVTGSSFNKNCEWQAELLRGETTMICCAANWGAGSYLVVRQPAPGALDDVPDGPTPPGPPGVPPLAPDGDGPPRSSVTHAELSLLEATLETRARAAIFRVVDCDGYVEQPYVSGRLVRAPVAPDGAGHVGVDRGGGGDKGAGAGGGWSGGAGSMVRGWRG